MREIHEMAALFDHLRDGYIGEGHDEIEANELAYKGLLTAYVIGVFGED